MGGKPLRWARLSPRWQQACDGICKGWVAEVSGQTVKAQLHHGEGGASDGNHARGKAKVFAPENRVDHHGHAEWQRRDDKGQVQRMGGEAGRNTGAGSSGSGVSLGVGGIKGVADAVQVILQRVMNRCLGRAMGEEIGAGEVADRAAATRGGGGVKVGRGWCRGGDGSSFFNGGVAEIMPEVGLFDGKGGFPGGEDGAGAVAAAGKARVDASSGKIVFVEDACKDVRDRQSNGGGIFGAAGKGKAQRAARRNGAGV